MKRVFSILYIICCCTLESADAQSAGISEVLKELQMENISVVQKQDTITAAFETSVYRGSYNGIGIAIRRLIQSCGKALSNMTNCNVVTSGRVIRRRIAMPIPL